MKTLEKVKSVKEEKLDGRTLEAQIASWSKPPPLKTVLTEELAHEIAENFLDGFTDEETAEMCFISLPTLRKWRNLSIIRNHERSRKKFYVHEIRDGKRRDWTRLAWWLERRYPLEFSRPEVAHAISTSIHTTVNTTQNLIVSAELAEQLAERSASVSAKIEALFANRPLNPAHTRLQSPLQEDSALIGTVSSKQLEHVKELATSITEEENVVLDPPLLAPGAGTPRPGGGRGTEPLSSTAPQKVSLPSQKVGGRRQKHKIGLQIPVEITEDSRNSDEQITRKNFDMLTKSRYKKPISSAEPLELEGKVVKVRTKSIVSPGDRPVMEEEIQRRSRETKLDRAALRAANKVADKLHPRKAHK